MTEGQKPGKLKKSTGSSVKHILSFALPLMLGTIFQQVCNLVDAMVVGYTLGDGAISAIGATSSVYSLLFFLTASFNNGFAIPIGQLFGAGNLPRLGFLGVCVTEPACWALMAALLGCTYLLKYRATRNEAA